MCGGDEGSGEGILCIGFVNFSLLIAKRAAWDGMGWDGMDEVKRMWF